MSKTTFLIALVALVAFIGFNSIYIVNEGQQTITTQFGEPVGGTITDAGLYFKIPMVHKIHYFDKRILKWTGKSNEIPTKKLEYVWLATTARWRIIDPLLFMQRFENESRGEKVLGDLINGAVRDFVTNNNLEEIIRSSDWVETKNTDVDATDKEVNAMIGEDAKKIVEPIVIKVGRDQFSRLVLNNARAKLTSNGIEILDVLVTRVNYTQDARKSAYSRMISERKTSAGKKRGEGQGEKNIVFGMMEKELKQISSDAYRQAEEIKGKADAKVTRLYGKAYGKDPDFYRFMLTLESYKEVLGQNTRLVVDSSSPFYKFLQGGQLK